MPKRYNITINKAASTGILAVSVSKLFNALPLQHKFHKHSCNIKTNTFRNLKECVLPRSTKNKRPKKTAFLSFILACFNWLECMRQISKKTDKQGKKKIKKGKTGNQKKLVHIGCMKIINVFWQKFS